MFKWLIIVDVSIDFVEFSKGKALETKFQEYTEE